MCSPLRCALLTLGLVMGCGNTHNDARVVRDTVVADSTEPADTLARDSAVDSTAVADSAADSATDSAAVADTAADSAVMADSSRDTGGGGEFTVLAEDLAFEPPRDAWFSMRVVRDGATHTFYVDGQRVLEATDATCARGSVGLYSFGMDDARFDDVVVLGQEGP